MKLSGGYKAVLYLLLCPYFMKESMTQKSVDVILEKGEEGMDISVLLLLIFGAVLFGWVIFCKIRA